MCARFSIFRQSKRSSPSPSPHLSLSPFPRLAAQVQSATPPAASAYTVFVCSGARRIQNRESATRVRYRKKNYACSLEQQLEELKDVNANLLQQNAKLQAENNLLKSQMQVIFQNNLSKSNLTNVHSTI